MNLKQQIPEIADGFHDLTDTEYFGIDAINRSFLWQMRRSPAHAKASTESTDTHALRAGSGIHCAILEPDRLDTDFSVRPAGIDGRTKAGKAALAAWKEESAGKTLLDAPQDMVMLQGIRDAINNNVEAKRICHGPGATEKTAVWTDEKTGVRCKAKYDRIVPIGDGRVVVADLKSTADAESNAFERSVRNFGYHFQAAYYLEGLNQVAGESFRSFVIIAVEKKAPFGVGIYELDIGYIEAGRRMMDQLLPLYAKCDESNHWPGYPEQTQILEAPTWI